MGLKITDYAQALGLNVHISYKLNEGRWSAIVRDRHGGIVQYDDNRSTGSKWVPDATGNTHNKALANLCSFLRGKLLIINTETETGKHIVPEELTAS